MKKKFEVERFTKKMKDDDLKKIMWSFFLLKNEYLMSGYSVGE